MAGGTKKRQLQPGGWGLFTSSAAVLAIGLVVTGAVWTALTKLLRYRWPWDKHLGHGQVVSELDITKVALSVVAGVGAAIALTVTYRRQRDAERSRFDERFAAAAAQLGGTSPAERLAGVYAIATMADETPERRQQCINLLCAYLRLPYDATAGLLSTVVVEDTWPTQRLTHREQRTYQSLPNDREVRLTIIEVIRAHLQPDASIPWHGHDFDFTGAVFDGGNFGRTSFTGGTVTFDHAQFVSGNANFDGARFTGGTVTFDHAQLTGGTISFFGAYFTDGSVTFNGARFSEGWIIFDRARLEGGSLSFFDADFAGGEITFTRAQFAAGHVTFDGARLTGGKVNLSDARFLGSYVSFRNARLLSGGLHFHHDALSELGPEIVGMLIEDGELWIGSERLTQPPPPKADRLQQGN